MLSINQLDFFWLNRKNCFRAFISLWLNSNISSKFLNDLLTDWQPKSRAFSVQSFRILSFTKVNEKSLHLIFCHSNTRIFDSKLDLIFSQNCSNCDWTTCCKFQRIWKNINQNLLQSFLIGDDFKVFNISSKIFSEGEF